MHPFDILLSPGQATSQQLNHATPRHQRWGRAASTPLTAMYEKKKSEFKKILPKEGGTICEEVDSLTVTSAPSQRTIRPKSETLLNDATPSTPPPAFTPRPSLLSPVLHQSSPLLVAAHTDSLAAVLECLAVVLRRLAAAVAATGDASVVARGEAIEATGLGLSRYGVGYGVWSVEGGVA